ncbi:MAG: hypothetical protein KKF46_08060 [Nanoarchaeota archaeon]|nr:hypothetical protein [Nanoarchaeota archaeon]MBU1322282.1 hypothetical protein [Nanoarchaeota archaeon]MBU1598035.1 hypothetical protein [Nanoarchaeota archaeon]MBU2440999.1 hypothetical protein [Nanoarchaeota archaeon]
MISQDKWFFFEGGGSIKSIEELKNELSHMDESTFGHHVNINRNDFANWIEGVFGESVLAQSMREVSEREGLIIILEEFLKNKDLVHQHYEQKHHELHKEHILAEHKNQEHKPTEENQKVIMPDEIKIFEYPKHEEKILTEQELKDMVGEAKEVLREKEHKSEHEPKLSDLRHHEHEIHKHEHHKFIVKEFIYGFVLGLIFGFILLGIIYNSIGAI